MTVLEYATKIKKNARTVSRWVEAYNKLNGKNFGSGWHDDVSDVNLFAFLEAKANKKEKVPQKALKQVVRKPKRSTLQQNLSSDGLAILVLIVLLFADSLAFGIIGHNKFNYITQYIGVLFSILGLTTGIGAIVTYLRIEKVSIAEGWKYLFGVCQFLVFFLAVNQYWFLAEIVMTLMFVFSFMGVLKSIRK